LYNLSEPETVGYEEQPPHTRITLNQQKQTYTVGH